MNENIDLTKILKDCPAGWEFYSSIYGNVKFLVIIDDCVYPIKLIYYDKNKGQKYEAITKQGLHDTNCYGECTLFPSKEQRDWSKFTAPWYKKEKFDPKTLQPFDRILVRDHNDETWSCNFFSHIREVVVYKFTTITSSYKQCIPYNDETKHLAGTTEEAPEYYRYWED